ncbi:hypothetical protein KRM28CT15_52290 [Krasilnikovia sp. M28-CT-15]
MAANIAHSYVPPMGVDSGWSPKPGAVLGAVFWPVAVFVATEILTRVAWPTGRVWWLLRWAGMLPVGAVAALVSYRHLSGLLAYYGEEPLVCVLGPLAVDGLMVMATGAILATRQHQHAIPESPSVPAGPDIAVGPAPTPITPTSTADSFAPSAADPTREPEPVPAPISVPSPAVVATRIAGADATGPTGSATALRDTARTPRPRPSTTGTPSAPRLAAPATDNVAALEPALPTPPIVAPELLNRARETARQYRTEHGTPITPGQLAVRLKVTSEQAAQALAVLGLGPDNPTNPIPSVNGTPAKASR